MKQGVILSDLPINIQIQMLQDAESFFYRNPEASVFKACIPMNGIEVLYQHFVIIPKPQVWVSS